VHDGAAGGIEGAPLAFFRVEMIKPKVHLDTYEMQTKRWKRLFDKIARKGESANPRTWKALWGQFIGDFDELNHMINDVYGIGPISYEALRVFLQR